MSRRPVLCDYPGCFERATNVTQVAALNTGLKTWFSCPAHVPKIEGARLDVSRAGESALASLPESAR